MTNSFSKMLFARPQINLSFFSFYTQSSTKGSTFGTAQSALRPLLDRPEGGLKTVPDERKNLKHFSLRRICTFLVLGHREV